VESARFKTEPEVDIEGRVKVYEIEHFPGKFKDSKGNEHDLRPLETMPSLNNFAKMERTDLWTLLMKAYEA